LSYLHGTGSIIPGLEQELEGKEVGDQFEVTLAAQDAYGERNEELQKNVPIAEFKHITNLDLGMQLQVQAEAGPMVVTVAEITDKFVTLDANHPLAGMALTFDVTVREVREATAEELAHGHVHGPGGHHH
jgi:FKBP-type peptidyl-prolyl cis-trans isomerase SlyD